MNGLLKRLCELEPETWRMEEASLGGWMPERAVHEKYEYSLSVSRNGEIEGGAALWWMLQTMRARYFDMSGDLRFDREFNALSRLMPATIQSLAAQDVVRTYIDWKESVLVPS